MSDRPGRSGARREAEAPCSPGRPAVSILMPVRDRADLLVRSVASVRAQTRGDWELMLVDDASTDGTPEVADALSAREPRIRPQRLSAPRGAAAARNAGLARSRGRYVAFLDSDDLWHPRKLERQLAFMEDSGAALSFTGYSRVTEAGTLVERVRAPSVVDHATLLRRNVMGALTVIYDTERLGKVLMPDLARQHDYALWLRITREHGPAYGLDEDLATYRIGTRSLSSDKLRAAADTWRVLRRHERIALPAAAAAFACYAWHGLRRRAIERGRR